MATRVPIRYGGTGANTAAGVRAALGVLSTSGGSFTGNLNVNSVIMANSRGVFGNSFQDHANSVGIDTSTVIVGAYANNDGPAEVMVVNKSNGSVAYAEFIALNDTANQEQGWISIGVNSSDYNDPEYTLTGPDDGYLLFEAPLGTAANGDLIIGTGSYGDKNRIVLAAGGFEPSDAQLLIAPANLKSASITQSRLNSNIAIFTTSATHNFVANDVVIISSVGAPYDGTRTILAVTANTFNVSITSANVALANVSPAGEVLEYLPFNKGTVELTAQLFVGENSKSTIETADITLAEGHAIPLGIVVSNDGPGQTVMFNKSNGALAFSEFIAHNDQGNVHQGWISMGINSSGYDDPEFPITKEDDGYLLFEAPAGTTGGGDLIIGTGTNGQTNRLIFAAEGFDEANAQMIITPDESVRISINTDSSSANTGALQVVGGVGVQGSMYVQGNQTIQGDLIVNGSQIIQSIENLAAAGPISLVGEGNIANTWDQGIVGTYAVAVGSVARNVAFKEIANNTGIISTSNNHSFIVEDIVTIAGVDATFNGTHRITAVTANTLSFYLLAGNASKTSSSGTATVDKTTKYTGLVKKASDGTWRIFSNLGSRPGFNTDLSAANLAYDSIIAGSGDFRGTLKLGSPNTATISYTDNNARALTIPALSGDRTFAFIDQAQTFTAAQGFNSTVTATKFIPSGGDATGNGLYLPSANRVSISADGVERVAISATETVVNDGSADYDFRVESDGVAHMLFVDGGTNTVGVGTNAPAANLHVQGTGYVSSNMSIIGSLAVGRTSPAAKLDVASASGAGNAIYFRGGTYTDIDYSTGIRFLQPAGTTNANRQFRFTSGASTLSIQGIVSSDGTDTADTQLILQPAGGNVGIGTTNPGSRLHISDSSGPVLRMVRTSNRFDIEADNNAMGFVSRDSGSANAHFSGFNGVGIGTSTPQGKLSVRTATSNTAAGNVFTWSDKYFLVGPNVGSAQGSSLGLGYNEELSRAEIVSLAPNIAWKDMYFYANSIRFHTNGIANFSAVLDNNGSVGIGITNPSNALTVVGKIESRGNASDANYAAFLSGIYDSAHALQLGVKINSGTESEILGVYADGGGGNPRTILNPSNSWKVGIGTTTPNAQGLTIYQGGADRRVLLELNRPNTPGLQTAIEFTVGGSIMVGRIQHEYEASNLNHMSFSLRSPGGGNFEAMRLKNNGYVGIGTNDPQSLLTLFTNSTANTTAIRILDVNNNGSSSTFYYPAISFFARRDGTTYVGPDALRNYSGSSVPTGGSTASIVFTDRPGTGGYPTAVRATDIQFWTATNNGGTALDPNPTRRMTITAEGNVQTNFDGANEYGYFYVGKDFNATNHRINRQVTQSGVILCISAYSASLVLADTALFYSVNSGGASGAATALVLGTNSTTSRSINAGGTINASGTDYAEYMTKNDDFVLSKGDICGVDSNGKLTNKFSEAHSFVVKSTNPSYVGGDIWGNEESIGKKPYLTTKQENESVEDYELRVAQHNLDMEAYNTALENARKLVDRIAFSGQVPVNVVGAVVGDYIIPIVGENDSIVGLPVAQPTFEQYQKAVGKVWKILEDGRAFISVKIG